MIIKLGSAQHVHFSEITKDATTNRKKKLQLKLEWEQICFLKFMNWLSLRS